MPPQNCSFTSCLWIIRDSGSLKMHILVVASDSSHRTYRGSTAAEASEERGGMFASHF